MITTTLHGDEAIQAELCDRVKHFLASRRFASFRKLNVTVLGDGVVLDGRVPSLHKRQLAVALCRHVPSLYRVVDRLIVPEPDGMEASAGMPRRRNRASSHV